MVNNQSVCSCVQGRFMSRVIQCGPFLYYGYRIISGVVLCINGLRFCGCLKRINVMNMNCTCVID